MAVIISGILRDGLSRPLANVAIRLTCLKTGTNVLVGVDADFKTGADGSYSVNVASGSYGLCVNFGGMGYERVGNVSVYNDSLPGSLEDFLTVPGVDEITPEILAQVIQARYDAVNAANNAANNATGIINLQLQDQESRFQQFLLSSGYVYLGEYENGPLQFSARNQYIAYNGQYFQISAGTGVGFTTTGTDADSFANDVEHLVLMDGNSIRQNLGAEDGLKWLGKCPDIASLRNIEPTYAEQSITLHRAVPGGAIIDAIFFYDDTDTTSEDDGYRIIVTPGGARWVTDCADGIDLRLGGLLANGSNFGAAANKIIRGEVKKIIDTATSFIRIVQAIKVPHPTYLSKNAHYTLEEQIIIPSFMGFTCSGWIDVRTSLTDHAIWVRNDETAFPGLKFNMGGYVNLQGFGAVRNANGRLRLLGPGATVSQGAGLAVGTPIAPVANASQINTRDICVSGLHVSGFKYGIGVYGYDNYIHTYEFCEVSRCMYPIAGLDINKQNSGERVLFRSCTIGGTSHNIYWNLVGWNITWDNCSVDYAAAAGLYLGNGARGCVFRFTNGSFMEGFGTNLVSQDSTSDAWEYDGGRLNKVYMHTCFLNCQKKPGEFSSLRQIFASASLMLGHLELVDTDVRFPDPESEPHVALLGYNDATATRVRGFFRNANTPYHQCLMRYGDSLNAGLYRLSGTEGAAVTLDPATNLTFSLTGGMTATYGGIDPEDGLVFVNLTATAETDTLEIRNQNLRAPVNRFNQLFSALSMKMSAVTAGAVTLATKLYYYGAPTLNTSLTGDTYTTTLSGSTYSTSRNGGAAGGTFQTTRTFAFLGSATGATRNVSSLLDVEGTPLTTEKYVGVQTYCEVAYQYALGTLKASPAIRVGGWVGTIQIKLPVYWIPKGTEANATSD